MRISVQYGKQGLEVDVPGRQVDLIQPRFLEGLADEARSFQEAVRSPIGTRPLREAIGPRERLSVVIPDVTRPMPSARLLGWLFQELEHVAPERVTIITGTGSHRACRPDELSRMVGDSILERYRVVNHDAYDQASLAAAGQLGDGHAIFLNRHYVEADRRIVLGFIEPHLMAGFSGGYKGVFPALADIDSILHYHGASVVGDPASTWGKLEGNPTQALVRDGGKLLPVDFLINVAQNKKREIVHFFCGDVMQAHREGCEFTRQFAMARCERTYPIVLTTNSGYPLDLNLYQTVKGMSAGAQIVEPGGYILTASECSDGFPAGNFKKLLLEHESPRAILDAIMAPGFSMYEQWSAQLFAMLALRARLGLHSSLPVEEVRRAHMDPVPDIGARISSELERLGGDAPIAVLPEGPMTIPYVAA
ncbi:MAG TPA: nickel-dependent lactate racemase [Polyangiaceae bacterium]|jgi:nickel-dependent lactate racemase